MNKKYILNKLNNNNKESNIEFKIKILKTKIFKINFISLKNNYPNILNILIF